MKTHTLRRCALFFFGPLALAAHAQPSQRITITGSAAAQAPSVAGFGDMPLWRAPFSATVIDQRALQDAGIASLADIIRSKQAANRPKDQRVLPTLREILARREMTPGT